MATTTVPSIKLAGGGLIPAIGFGTGTAWYKPEEYPLNRATVESIKSAIAAGHRHLDCAEVYRTESEVGVAIKESGIAREELFITTKIMRNMTDPEASLKEALQKLQVSYVDLFLIHTPSFPQNSPSIPDTWAAFERLHHAGLARFIGVSNFTTPQLHSLISSASVKPAVNQVELNPYCTDPALFSLCKEHNIVLAAYSPLAPIRMFKSGPLTGVVDRIASELGRTPAQVLLRWVVEQGCIAVTTTSNEERQKEFLKLDFELGEERLQEITREGAKEHHRIYWLKEYGDE